MSLSDVIPGSGQDPIDSFRQSPSRRGVRAAKRRRTRRRRRTWVMLLVGLLVIGGAAGAAWVTLRPVIQRMTEPNDYPGPGAGTVSVEVLSGATGTDIAALLTRDGVVKTAKAFVDAYNANPDSGGIQPGVYSLRRQMAAAEALAALLDPANRQTLKVVVPEGKRVSQTVEALAKALSVRPADVQAALANPALGLPAEAKGNPEGWLFPARYDLHPDASPLVTLQAMVARTVQVLTELGVPRARWHDVVVEASLVQAEGGRLEDFGKIARVLQNRIAIRMPLQLDTTVHYATGKFTIATSDADTRVKSPYNTYLFPGLPVAAICNPGEAAIRAVLTPTPGPWRYFVTTDPTNRVTEFGVTAADFAKLKAKYDRWQKAHPGA